MLKQLMVRTPERKYVTHVINFLGNGVSAMNEYACSRELTELVQAGWRELSHEVSVKRHCVVHAWVMERWTEEPETPAPEKEAVVVPLVADEWELSPKVSYDPSEQRFPRVEDVRMDDITPEEQTSPPAPSPINVEGRKETPTIIMTDADETATRHYEAADVTDNVMSYVDAVRSGKFSLDELKQIGNKLAIDKARAVYMATPERAVRTGNPFAILPTFTQPQSPIGG